ncbi:uncharacterized protein LOC122052517 [Zingiber officinale]|uniref:uncharacterized protein LOC122052517 n=1 Tax=Zingiber officinale TaxID=94328 RepID=UPI001C4CB534|nr:uncharacterized protein LOC122052517 [Zingiber officinale]
MEGGKKKSSSIADDLSPSRKSPPPPSSNLSASSPGHFSGVFPPPSAVAGKSHGNKSKTQTVQSKDGKPVVTSTQYEESTYFGSSVHYGGRDFYDSSASNQPSGAPKPYKDSYDKGENPNDPNVANRGEWWQGSLYY